MQIKPNLGRLTLFTGKMGAGKSTLSVSVARKHNAVLIAEDEWLGSLYPNQILTLEDYVRFSTLLKPQVKKLVQAILQTGTDVVMDFPANTISQRAWLKSIFIEIGAPHALFYINASNERCLRHIEKRRLEQPERAKTDTKEMFEAVTQYFQAPESHEGFNVTTIDGNA